MDYMNDKISALSAAQRINPLHAHKLKSAHNLTPFSHDTTEERAKEGEGVHEGRKDRINN